MASDLFPDSPREVTLDDQIAAAERELKLRKRVYAHQVNQGKMSEAFAAHQLAAMAAICETLRQCRERGHIATMISRGMF